MTEERLLTADEREALLGSLGHGRRDLPEMDGGIVGAPGGPEMRHRVKEYDFRRPEKFSRDQLRTLRGIHDQFVRLLNSTLAGYLRTTVQCVLDSVEQASYEEFTGATKEGNLIFVVSLDPLPAPILLEVSADLIFASIDRLLGGAGRALPRERDVTELERALFQENWLAPVLDNLRTAWQMIVTITPAVGAVETNAGFVQIALPSDVVVSVKVNATIGDAEGAIRLCYTYATLEPIVPQLDTQRLFATNLSRRQVGEEEVRRTLSTVRVPIIARLGTAIVTVEELLELQRGDVIRLDTLVDDEIEILVSGVPKYRGRPGLKPGRHQLAVRIGTVLEARELQGELNGSAR